MNGPVSRTKGEVDEEKVVRLEDKDYGCCPITFETMSDPVLLEGDKHTYERSAIEGWLKNNNRSPKTNLPLDEEGC